MPSESFLRRWSRRKTEVKSGTILPDPEVQAHRGPATPEPDRDVLPATQERSPTLDDVAKLTGDADYSLFISKGVDETVRRAALKKLFSDPHFNVMDGLDIYIDDYTKPSPISPAMFEALRHAESTLNPVVITDPKPEDLIKETDAAPAPANGLDDADVCNHDQQAGTMQEPQSTTAINQHDEAPGPEIFPPDAGTNDEIGLDRQDSL